MAHANLTLRKSDYSACGIERRDDVRHEILIGTAVALVAAGLIESHQISGQPGTGKTMTGYGLAIIGGTGHDAGVLAGAAGRA